MFYFCRNAAVFFMSRLICLCNRITTNRIENFLKKFPQAELSDVMQSTAAST